MKIKNNNKYFWKIVKLNIKHKGTDKVLNKESDGVVKIFTICIYSLNCKKKKNI